MRRHTRARKLAWDPDAVMPPGRTAWERHQMREKARRLSAGFWIAAWSLACAGLTVLDRALAALLM